MSYNPTSEKLTFMELIQKHKIEIPIIQRDYAQGREGKEELRTNFLGALLQAILDDNKKIELDFVYGNVKNDKEATLQPLDGQQRLTTLFLLHWFVAIKENKLDDKLKELLTKFSYETRTSSREFCNELINKAIDYKTESKISEQIIDSFWFFLSWKKDPTIKSMLTMLDAIEQIFHNKTDIFEKLNNISFHFIELENFGLSDDLYIKMNARGKPLTEFENFKAKFEQYINQNKWEEDVEIKEKFSHKIDTKWIDLFWKYKNDKNVFDEQILKFMAEIAILLYAQNKEIYHNEQEIQSTKNELLAKNKSKEVSDEAVKTERIERRIAQLSNDFNKIRPNDFLTKNDIIYLKECFDCYSDKDTLFPNLTLWSYASTENNLFKIALDSTQSTSYKQRVLFYAQTQYLLKYKEINQESFNDWIRVVRNIVENSTIDSAITFIGAINLINELSKGCDSIYDSLLKNSILSRFAESQVKEEIKKAEIIIKTNATKQVIHKVEDTDFCKGRIEFVLYCCIDNQNSIENMLNVITTNFKELNDSLLDNFKRAFLTIGDNNYYNVWGTWSYSFNCNKRWLLKTVSDLKFHFSNSEDWKREYLKELFIKLINSNYETIIANYEIPQNMPKWKERLIKEENLLQGATYILIPNDNSYCKLAWQKKPSNENQIKEIK